MMYYLSVVTDKLAQSGLSYSRIKDYTGIDFKYIKEKPLVRRLKKQPVTDDDINRALTKIRWGVSFVGIIDQLQCNPNKLYDILKGMGKIKSIPLVDMYRHIATILREDGLSYDHIAQLMAPLINTTPTPQSIFNITKTVNVNRQSAGRQKQDTLIDIIKFIVTNRVKLDYRGFNLLKSIYDNVDGKTISTAMLLSKSKIVKKCNVCNKEFLSGKQQLFCRRCRRINYVME